MSTENQEQKKTASSAQDIQNPQDTSKFGSRLLVDDEQVFAHNAWDHVEWDSDQEKQAKEKVAKQAENPVSDELKEKYDAEAANFWDKFYAKNENKFFKDRHWLKIEFPELFSSEESYKERFNVMEIGCGAGNTMFPLLAENKDPNLFVYGCDFSSVAVDVVKVNISPQRRIGRSKAFVWDLTDTNLPECVEPGSIDVIVLVFVVSAINPKCWNQVVTNLNKLLKPGGRILFRDYGRYDLAQLRFKGGRYLDENFYVRGDGTQVYFFTSEEIQSLFGEKFTIEQNAVDRRLIVNRHRKLKMYRVWLQGKFIKPSQADS
ncbi:methyltransferase [Basidiobolus meristosporus CBS 931.73]|uniref:tRNA N(3)-methylcytidine methyltransferase n=1 Tax=Basidiobolus meristosporus CBS 931.73 TaxID=1314790 RepID=A0A1Y1XIN9_9FUNG|nr:methyltransferase [Basidiobolus meristosporus CBS 931.73]|eukprot:ORX85625.1 methyltransferase [Basidiobolus meristosporus CBS 931.73]